jgi:hypothetical protein
MRCAAQDVKAGTYKLQKFCMEPTSFTVKEESSFKGGETEFVKTKLMTRLTYTLDEVRERARIGALWRQGTGGVVHFSRSGTRSEPCANPFPRRCRAPSPLATTAP